MSGQVVRGAAFILTIYHSLCLGKYFLKNCTSKNTKFYNTTSFIEGDLNGNVAMKVR